MKRPIVKFLNQIEVPGLTQVFSEQVDNTSEVKMSKFKEDIKDDYYAALIGQDEVIFCSKLKIDNKELWIPEPNPVLIYFTEAYVMKSAIKKSKNDLNEIARQLNGSSNIQTYPYLLKFFAQASRIIIFLFLSLEAFINQQTPEDVKYINKKGKTLDKSKIERYLPFDEKVDNLLPHIFKKESVADLSQVRIVLTELKDLRDKLTHLKTKQDKYRNKYREVLNLLLASNFDELIYSTEKFMNYYVPNYVEFKNIEK